MQDFTFCVPTNFIFGKNAHTKVGEELQKLGVKKVLIHHDSGRFLYSTNLLHDLCEDISHHNIQVLELGGVQPNPRLSLVKKAIELVRAEQVDFILGIGGGSVVDSCKAAAAGALFAGDVWDIYANGLTVDKALPLGVVLTNPATSSESNAISVVYNEVTNEKLLATADATRPTIVFMNPELTYSLPKFVTACGIVDMFSHTCERYFSPSEEIGLTDHLEEGMLKTLVDIGPKLMVDPQNYFLRANAMWAGTVAHNNTLSVGRETDWATHLLGNELSALYDTPHGATLSILMASWMRYVYKQKPMRFARYAHEVFGIAWDAENTLDVARLGIEATESFFNAMNMPTSFSAYEIPTDRLNDMLDRIPFSGNDASIGGIVRINRQDAKKIYEMAF